MSLSETWKDQHRYHSGDQAARVANALKCLKLVVPLIRIDRVVDFGCGIGAWLRAAQMLGASDILGIEGEWIADANTVIDKGLIQRADLAEKSPTFSKEYDLAISIEVAEHLPEASADAFVSSLVSASEFVLFSAAIPGQGGNGHLNEQPLPYWVSKFWALGFVPLDPVRPYIANDLSIYSWLRQNVVMFVNYDRLITSDLLLRQARPIADFRLHYRPLKASRPKDSAPA